MRVAGECSTAAAKDDFAWHAWNGGGGSPFPRGSNHHPILAEKRLVSAVLKPCHAHFKLNSRQNRGRRAGGGHFPRTAGNSDSSDGIGNAGGLGQVVGDEDDGVSAFEAKD